MSSDPGRASALVMRARELIAAGWCQRDFAHDAAGAPILPVKPAAVSWCITGALVRATSELGTLPHLYGAAVSDLTRHLVKEEGPMTLTVYNDAPGRTQAEVLTLLDSFLVKRR